jgi:Lon protease-like protein
MKVVNLTKQKLEHKGYRYDEKTKNTTLLKPIGNSNKVFTIEEYNVRNPPLPIPDVEPIPDLQQQVKTNEEKIEEFAYEVLRIAFGKNEKNEKNEKKTKLYEIMRNSQRIVSLVNDNNIKNHTLKNQEEVLKRKREEDLIRREHIHEKKREKIKVVLRTCIDNI